MVSKHQHPHCLLNRLFRRRPKKSKFRVTGLREGNSPVAGEFPTQRASNAENASIWWRHHDNAALCVLNCFSAVKTRDKWNSIWKSLDRQAGIKYWSQHEYLMTNSTYWLMQQNSIVTILILSSLAKMAMLIIRISCEIFYINMLKKSFDDMHDLHGN